MHDGSKQADDVALGDPAAGQEPGHAVGGAVPLAEGEGAARPRPGGLDVRLDVGVDPGRLPQDRHDGRVPIQGMRSVMAGGDRTRGTRTALPPRPPMLAACW